MLKNYFLILLAIILLLLLTSSAALSAVQAALIVGVSQYSDANMGDLKYADSDAKEVALKLKNWGGYANDKHCFKVLTNKNATKKKIEKAFKDINKKCLNPLKGKGNFLFFFSGHADLASSSENAYFKKIGIKSHEFLAPHDVDTEGTYGLMDGSKVNDTYIKKEWLAQTLRKLNANEITVIIDACHSGIPDLEGLMTSQSLGGRKPYSFDARRDTKGHMLAHRYINPNLENGKKIALLSASKESEKAREFDELEHGALTYSILNALDEKRVSIQPNTFYEMSVGELYKNIYDLFSYKVVEGNPLIFYHDPQLYYLSTAQNNLFTIIRGVETDKISGKLYVETDPPKAIISIDGIQQIEKTNTWYNVMSGNHILVASMPDSSFRQVVNIDVSPAGKEKIRLVLTGDLTIKTSLKKGGFRSGPKIDVYIDEEYKGKSGKKISGLLAGTHNLKVVYKGTEKRKTVEIRPDSPLTIIFFIKHKKSKPVKKKYDSSYIAF